MILGVAGAIALWLYREQLAAEGLDGILTVLASYAAVGFALWTFVPFVGGAIPTIRFRSMTGRFDRLTDEFAACAVDGGARQRFAVAVDDMLRICRELDALRVPNEVVETNSDDPQVIADVARQNRDEARRLAYLTRQGLTAARAASVGVVDGS